jgi:hypothetical protein
MAILTREISEKLMAKLRNTGRPAEDVVVETFYFVSGDKQARRVASSVGRQTENPFLHVMPEDMSGDQ